MTANSLGDQLAALPSSQSSQSRPLRMRRLVTLATWRRRQLFARVCMLRHSLSRQPVAALNARRTESKMSFDTERFIIEIENRPCLWNNGLKEYSDRNLKIKCWDEMVNIFKEKEDMTNAEKKELCKCNFLLIIC